MQGNYHSIYLSYLRSYFETTLPECLAIVRGFVPIDTMALHNAIEYYTYGEFGGILVQDLPLDYSNKKKELQRTAVFEVEDTIEARVLAHILEVGIGTFKVSPTKRTLYRTRSNKYAEKGDPTTHWWADAMKEVEEIARKHAKQHFEDMTQVFFDEAFRVKGWERK
jgi:hypothetical protein